MNTTPYLLAAALVLGTTLTFAGNGNGPSGGDGSCTGNCPTTETGGGSNEQSQEQTSVNQNSNTNSADANSASISGASAGSTSYAGGGDSRVHVGVKTGPTSSSSNSSAEGGAGGLAVAGGGSARVGDTEASASNGGNSTGDIDIEGDEYSYTNDHDYSASSAASVFAGECQTGMSGQVEAGGFAVVNADQFCQHVKAARVMLDAYNWEIENGSFECTAVEYGYTTAEGSDVVMETLQEVCGSEKAVEYLAEYRHHVEEATGLVRATETVGFVDTISGYLVRPVALIAVLILLL